MIMEMNAMMQKNNIGNKLKYSFFLWLFVIILDYSSILHGEKPTFMIPVEFKIENEEFQTIYIGLGYAIVYKHYSPDIKLITSTDFYILIFKVQTINTY